MLALLVAFLGGLATVFAPCILPILPVVLSAGATGGKKRPLGIITGLIASFRLVSLSLSALVPAFNFNPEVLRTISALVLLVIGIVLCLPKILAVVETKISSLIPSVSTTSDKSDYWSGVVLGASLGLVWTPCLGPIMATVATLSATAGTSAVSVAITLAYAIGAGIPLLAIAYGGRGLTTKLRGLSGKTELLQRIFGVILVLSAISTLVGLDRAIQTALLEVIPEDYYSGLTQQLEQSEAVQKSLQGLVGE